MGAVDYGLSSLYYAKITDTDGEITYGTPVAWPGARSLELSPTGEPTQIYADDIIYATIEAGAGYEGDLTTLTIPESFYTDILGMKKDENGALVESESDIQSAFALLGQFKSNEADKQKRFALYHCTVTKPDFGGTTKEDSVEAHEYTMTLTMSPATDTGYTKASITNAATSATAYNSWFGKVYTPDFQPGE